MKISSYHDVVVYIDDVKYVPSQNFALELTCCKSGGWRLWKICGGKSKLIGGEFDGTRMCITVSDKVILGILPEIPIMPDGFGWNGTVSKR
jgi:hypothetical protein